MDVVVKTKEFNSKKAARDAAAWQFVEFIKKCDMVNLQTNFNDNFEGHKVKCLERIKKTKLTDKLMNRTTQRFKDRMMKF